MISQLTVFLQNEEGRLASACRTIGEAGVNMRSLFIADTKGFGVARIICDTPQKACDALVDAGFRATLTPVVAVCVNDAPGGLAGLLDTLGANGMNVEYGYCFSADGDVAVDVLKVSDPNVEKVLSQAGYNIVKPEELYQVD